MSLLVGELAFGASSERTEHVRLAVLAGSLLAASLAAVVLRRRNAAYRTGPPIERIVGEVVGSRINGRAPHHRELDPPHLRSWIWTRSPREEGVTDGG